MNISNDSKIIKEVKCLIISQQGSTIVHICVLSHAQADPRTRGGFIPRTTLLMWRSLHASCELGAWISEDHWGFPNSK